ALAEDRLSVSVAEGFEKRQMSAKRKQNLLALPRGVEVSPVGLKITVKYLTSSGRPSALLCKRFTEAFCGGLAIGCYGERGRSTRSFHKRSGSTRGRLCTTPCGCRSRSSLLDV